MDICPALQFGLIWIKKFSYVYFLTNAGFIGINLVTWNYRLVSWVFKCKT